MGLTVIKKFEDALVTAADKFIANGGSITDGIFYSIAGKHYCPIGALTADDQEATSIYNKVLAKGFDISEGQFWSFVNGFDGYRDEAIRDDEGYYKLGKKLRRKYIAGKKKP